MIQVCLVSRCRRVLAAILIAALFHPSMLSAASGKRYALVIGVSKYVDAKLGDLSFTVNDARDLAKTLDQHGGFEVTQIHDGSKLPPVCDEIMSVLKDFLGPRLNHDGVPLTEADDILVYFSGHGAKVGQEDGESMYLCPQDYNRDKPQETGVPIRWLRDQLKHCRAKTKLLILDSCHAGAPKGTGEKLAYARPSELTRKIDFENVVTLASCRSNESSYMSDALGHSIFTYHLIEGLKGHADRLMDGRIDVDELYAYVYERVERDARRIHQRTQTPVRHIGLGTAGIPVICSVLPMTLDQLLEDMAWQLAYELHSHGELAARTIVPLEFAVADAPYGSMVLSLDCGVLGRYCGDTLRRHLSNANKIIAANKKQGVPSFEVAETDWISEKGLVDRIDANNVYTPPRNQLQRHSAVLAVGIIKTRVGPLVGERSDIVLSCELLGASSGHALARAGGKARIAREEWAMSGWSALVHSPTGAEHPDRKFDFRHPIQQADKQFPFPVGIRIGQEFLPAKFDGNRMYVPVTKGENFEVVIEYPPAQGNEKVMMRLLVDGLNTLPQHIIENGQGVFRAAPRVHLEQARAWVLDPSRSRRFAVRGFVTKTGPQGKSRKFEITDRESSLAARMHFTDQIGVITAAFYRADPNREKGILARFGVVPGDEFEQDLTEARNVGVGEALAYLTIHYVDLETWKNQISADPVRYMGNPSTQ